MWEFNRPWKAIQNAKSQTYNVREISLNFEEQISSKQKLLKRQKSCDLGGKRQETNSVQATKMRKNKLNGEIQKVQIMKNLRLKNVSALYSEWMAKAKNQTINRRQYNKLTLQTSGLIQQNKRCIGDDQRMQPSKTKQQNEHINLNVSINKNKILFQNSLLKNIQKSVIQRKSYQLLQKKNNQNCKENLQDFKLKIEIVKGSFLKKEEQTKLKYQGKIHQLKKQIKKIQSDKKQLLFSHEVLKEELKLKDIQVKKLKVEVAQLIEKMDIKRKFIDKGSQKSKSCSRRNSSSIQILERNSVIRRNSSNIQKVRRESALQILSKFYQKQKYDKNNDRSKFKHSSVNLKALEIAKNNDHPNSTAIKASRFKAISRKSSKISSFIESQNASSMEKKQQNCNEDYEDNEDSGSNSVDINYYKDQIKCLNRVISELREQIQFDGVMVLKCKLNQLKADRELLQQEIQKLKNQIKENWKNRMAMRDSFISLQKRLQVFEEREKFTFQQWGNVFYPSKGNIPAVLKRKIQASSEAFGEIQILQNIWKKMADYYDSLIKSYSKKIKDTIYQCEQLTEKYLKVFLVEGNQLISKRSEVKRSQVM